jgi:hypothetical protein
MEEENWVEDKSEGAEGGERTKKNMNGGRRRIKTHVSKRNKINV